LVHREQRPGVWIVLHNAQMIHESSINGVAFAPHEFGLMLATASSDGRVAILKHLPNHTWSIEYITDCSTGVNAVCWAPFGSYCDANVVPPTENGTANHHVPADQQPRIATAGCDNVIRFYVCRQGQWTLEHSTANTNIGHTDWVRDVAWAPCLLPNHNTLASCSEDRTVIIWTQKPNSGASDEWTGTVLHTFDDPVWRVSWSVTGHLLAVSSGDSNMTLWKASLSDPNHWTQVETTTESQ
jgi:protein transport protein SEC13